MSTEPELGGEMGRGLLGARTHTQFIPGDLCGNEHPSTAGTPETKTTRIKPHREQFWRCLSSCNCIAFTKPLNRTNPRFSKKINEMKRQLELLPRMVISDLATLENDLFNNEFGKITLQSNKNECYLPIKSANSNSFQRMKTLNGSWKLTRADVPVSGIQRVEHSYLAEPLQEAMPKDLK